MKKLFSGITVILCSIWFFTFASYAGISCNMYVTDHDSDADYIEYSIAYDTAEEYHVFANWMKSNNELLSEDASGSSVRYSYKTSGKLQDWDENGQPAYKEITLYYTTAQKDGKYSVTTASPIVFYIANRIAGGELGAIDWADYGKNGYAIK